MDNKMSGNNEGETQSITFEVPTRIAQEFLLYCPEEKRNAELIKFVVSLLEKYKNEAIENLLSPYPINKDELKDYELNSVEIVRRLRGG